MSDQGQQEGANVVNIQGEATLTNGQGTASNIYGNVNINIENTGRRIEDAFLEVPKVFTNAAQFKRFALSRKGLSLSMLEVENIKDNARSVEERNLQMLTQWKYKNGESATTEKIWQLVDGFLNEDGSEQDSPHPTTLAQSVKEERVSNVPLGASLSQSADQLPKSEGTPGGEVARCEESKRVSTVPSPQLGASPFGSRSSEPLVDQRGATGGEAASGSGSMTPSGAHEHQGTSATGRRIEDAFLEVQKVFANAAQFKRFALSRKGLSLSMLEVENIKDNARYVEERNLQMLTQWKYKNGESATTEKIWQLVDGFLNEDGSEQDSPHPTTLLQSLEEERVSNVPLGASLSQSADQFPKPQGTPGGEVARCEESKRVSSVPSPQLGASPFGSRSSEPLVDQRGATGGKAASGSGSMTPSGAHEHQGTSATDVNTGLDTRQTNFSSIVLYFIITVFISTIIFILYQHYISKI
uniref:uncharacterized protein LOC120337194 n=1 Tax=Styela clava TaxID=7725 RepID=UPI0019395114|nr:uncharacterized protein LOC120337194 [Styela clava]